MKEKKENDHHMSLKRDSISRNCNSFDCFPNYVVQQVRSDNLIQYHFVEYPTRRSEKIGLNLKLDRKKAYKGSISNAGQKRMIKRIMCWNNAIKEYNKKKCLSKSKHARKLVFLTLTLPSRQVHSDKKIKAEILAPFIRRLNRAHAVIHYIWKAEKQKNDNIHFHLLIDRYIDKKLVRKDWDRFTNRLGYIDRYKGNDQGKQTASTWIEIMRTDKQLSMYLAKYMGKNDQGGLIEGAVWKASSELYNLEYFELIPDNEQLDLLHEKFENKELIMRVLDQCTVFCIKNRNIKSALTDYFKREYRDFYIRTYEYLYLNYNGLCYKTYVTQHTEKQNLKSDFSYTQLECETHTARQLCLDILPLKIYKNEH